MNALLSRLKANTLAKDSIIVFIGSMVANVAAYTYHLLMGRQLGPAGYGELSSLTSILYVFSVPLTVIQMVLVRMFTDAKAQNELGYAKDIMMKAFRSIFIALVVGFGIILMFTPLIGSFLQLTNAWTVLLVYFAFVWVALMTIGSSALQSYQKFILFSCISAIPMVAKVIFSIPAASYGVVWVVVAMVLANILSALIVFPMIHFIVRVKRAVYHPRTGNWIGFAIPMMLSTLGMTSMYSTDILLVRHYFPPIDAGMYAALGVLGKIVFYASAAIGMVLYPVISERNLRKVQTAPMIRLGILFVIAISVSISIIYAIAPQWIISLLFGNGYIAASPYLFPMAIFLSLFSLGNIIVLICFGLGRTKVWIVSIAAAILQIIGITLFHTSIFVVLTVNTIVALLLVIGAASVLWKQARYEKI